MLFGPVSLSLADILCRSLHSACIQGEFIYNKLEGLVRLTGRKVRWPSNPQCRYVARSSRGPGHRPLKAEIKGSNPLRATKLRHEKGPRHFPEAFFLTYLSQFFP